MVLNAPSAGPKTPVGYRSFALQFVVSVPTAHAPPQRSPQYNYLIRSALLLILLSHRYESSGPSSDSSKPHHVVSCMHISATLSMRRNQTSRCSVPVLEVRLAVALPSGGLHLYLAGCFCRLRRLLPYHHARRRDIREQCQRRQEAEHRRALYVAEGAASSCVGSSLSLGGDIPPRRPTSRRRGARA